MFRRVITQYHDYIDAGDTLMRQYPKNNGIVSTNPLEFCCDVETSAFSALTNPERDFFRGFYVERSEKFIALVKETLGPSRYASVKKRVQTKVGKSFEDRGVFPINLYTQRIDCR